MKRSRLYSFFALTLVLSLLLSACNFGNGNGVQDKTTLVMTTKGEPPNLDSATSTDTESFIILGNVMEGLYRYDASDKAVPAIAEGPPQVSPDKLTYTFKIRDAKWSDGVPVKAQDFEYAWKRALDPATASQYSFILEPIKNAMKYNEGKAKPEEVGVKALDDKTLQVTLEHPTPYFLDLLPFTTYLPQRKDIVEKYGKDFAKEADKNVYNGPFKLTVWNHNSNYVLEKNESYWDAKSVKLQKIDTKILKDTAAQIRAYEANQVQFAEVTDDFIAKYKNDPNLKTIYEPSTWYLEFNQRKPFFQNKKVRQAINLAIDKKTLVEGVRRDASKQAGAIVPPSINANGDDPNQKFRQVFPDQIQYNPQEAKRLWDEALKEMNLQAPPPIEFVGDDTSHSKRQMEFIKEELRKNLGVDVTIVSVPFKQRLDRGKAGQFDLLNSGWNGDFNDPVTFIEIFTSENSYNRGKWSNKEYDALVEKSKNNSNYQERLQDLGKAEKILIEEQGIVPLYYRSRNFLVKPEAQGIVFTQFGEDFSYKWASIK